MGECFSGAVLTQIGKEQFFYSDGDVEKKNAGLRLLLKAQELGDPEAMYIVSRLVLDGAVKPPVGDPGEFALELMCRSADKGWPQARGYLNAYCNERYRDAFGDIKPAEPGELADFDGKPIRINRKGVLTPVDAVLSRENGRNVLTLQTNVVFVYGEELEDPEAFEQAVCDGLRAWQGEYTVFGGQKLTVRVILTRKDNAFDNLLVMPLTGELRRTIRSVSDALVPGKDRRELVEDVIANSRSFAVSGLKWSVNSRKLICIQSRDGSFADLEEILHVAKHEFGHVLGLGDLYQSSVDELEGVEKGTFTELDSYAINKRFYNLVMCDHHGPVSNNDVEMVVLAFRENKMQLYQPKGLKGKVSSALGRGN